MDDCDVANKKTITLPISERLIASLALAYVMLPIGMFLLNWVRLYVSIPLTGGLVYGAIMFCRNISTEHKTYAKSEVVKFAVTLLLLFILAFLTGVTGNVSQYPDIRVRTPMYFQLIDYAWPQMFPDGHMFIYYLSFWLPPAWMSHFFDFSRSAANWLLVLWMTIGLWFAFSLYFIKKERNVLRCLLFLCVSQTFLVAINKILILQPFFNDSVIIDILVACNGPVFLNILPHIWNTFNHAIPLIIIAFLVFLNYNKKCLILLLSLAATSSPIGVFGFIPFAVLKFYNALRKISFSLFIKENISMINLIAGMLAIVMFVFYTRGAGGGFRFVWMNSPYIQKIPPFDMMFFAIIIAITAAIIPIILMYWNVFKGNLFKIYIFYMIVCPFVFVGMENNELLFKSMLIPYLFYAIDLSMKKNVSLKSWPRLCVIVVFCVMTLGMKKLRSLTFDPQQITKNIRLNEERVDLYSPNTIIYSQFIDIKQLPTCLFIIPKKMDMKE